MRHAVFEILPSELTFSSVSRDSGSPTTSSEGNRHCKYQSKAETSSTPFLNVRSRPTPLGVLMDPNTEDFSVQLEVPKKKVYKDEVFADDEEEETTESAEASGQINFLIKKSNSMLCGFVLSFSFCPLDLMQITHLSALYILLHFSVCQT